MFAFFELLTPPFNLIEPQQLARGFKLAENTQDQIPMTFMDRVGHKSYRQWVFCPCAFILCTKLQLCDIRSYILPNVCRLFSTSFKGENSIFILCLRTSQKDCINMWFCSSDFFFSDLHGNQRESKCGDNYSQGLLYYWTWVFILHQAYLGRTLQPQSNTLDENFLKYHHILKKIQLKSFLLRGQTFLQENQKLVFKLSEKK